MVAASSALLRMNGVGAALSPILVGALIAAFGPKVYFAVLATLTGALALYGLWRKTRRSALPASRKRPLVAAEPHAVTGRLTASTGEVSGHGAGDIDRRQSARR
jgi:membrane protein implicated in regulation of membrane protease activity